jgi:hypothetical protein
MKFLIYFVNFLLIIKCGIQGQTNLSSNNGLIWTLLYIDKGNSTYFELITELPSASDVWSAFAFSNDQKMGDDTVCMCKYVSSTQSSIEHYYNVGKQTELLVSNEPSIGISDPLVSYNNGLLNCSFIREKFMNTNERYFDIRNNSAFILTAYGSDARGSLNQKKKNKL